MALPTNVGYGTVTGRFLLAYADGVDVDPQPDGVAAQGSVFFTPSPANVKDVSASPAPVTILPAKVEATLDSEGYLCGYGTTRGIRLVATDDTDLNPVDWTWEVEFRLTDPSGTAVPLSSFSFELPQDATVDLAVAGPVPGADGTYYTVGPQGPQGETGDAGPANVLSIGTVTTGAAGSSASATITGTSPTQTLSLTIPRGDQGIQGIQGIQGETGPVGPTGATGLNWQGVWSNTTDYVNDDAVYYNNSSWFASGDPTVGEEPTLSATHWMPLALQGATGATGAQGPQGIQGEQGPAGSLDNLTATLPLEYNSGTSTLSLNTIDGGSA